MKHFYDPTSNPRTKDLSSPLDHIRIAIVGLGGGGEIALHLMRSGIRKFKLFDFDILESGNLVRHICGSEYVGKNKASSVRDLLERYNPACKGEIEVFEENILLELENLESQIANCDLVICATDTDASRFGIAEVCSKLKKTALTVSMFGMGSGGEVFIQRPKMACFGCLSLHLERDDLLMKYASTQKKADCSLSRDAVKMPGLGIDQSFLTALVARKSLDSILIHEEHSLVSLGGNEANWILFSLTGVSGATDSHLTSLFLGVEKKPQCPICQD